MDSNVLDLDNSIFRWKEDFRLVVHVRGFVKIKQVCRCQALCSPAVESIQRCRVDPVTEEPTLDRVARTEFVVEH